MNNEISKESLIDANESDVNESDVVEIFEFNVEDIAFTAGEYRSIRA